MSKNCVYNIELCSLWVCQSLYSVRLCPHLLHLNQQTTSFRLSVPIFFGEAKELTPFRNSVCMLTMYSVLVTNYAI